LRRHHRVELAQERRPSSSSAAAIHALTFLFAAATATACVRLGDRFAGAKTTFNGDSALSYTKQHLAVGPRTPGTPAHDSAARWIVAKMERRADTVLVQRWPQTTKNGTTLELENIVARFNPQAPQRVLYVTHWDTRPVADEDPNLANRAQPVLGANDGAAGVGFFVALADVFKKTPPAIGVDLLFIVVCTLRAHSYLNALQRSSGVMRHKVPSWIPSAHGGRTECWIAVR
jgi:Peptidase family M28.